MDTPAIKFPYTATVHSPLPILLSALRISPPLEAPQPPIDGTLHTTKWHQPIAIPSYLLAIAGGEVAFRALGERTGVWAEAGKVDACAREFQEDAERFIKTAEELCGPYKWGRYDALVLPFSFPFGGMENPNVRRPRSAGRSSRSLGRQREVLQVRTGDSRFLSLTVALTARR